MNLCSSGTPLRINFRTARNYTVYVVNPPHTERSESDTLTLYCVNPFALLFGGFTTDFSCGSQLESQRYHQEKNAARLKRTDLPQYITLERRTRHSPTAHDRSHKAAYSFEQTLSQSKSRDGPETAICIQRFDVLCVLQFTLLYAVSCVLHRPASRVIHR